MRMPKDQSAFQVNAELVHVTVLKHSLACQLLPSDSEMP